MFAKGLGFGLFFLKYICLMSFDILFCLLKGGLY